MIKIIITSKYIFVISIGAMLIILSPKNNPIRIQIYASANITFLNTVYGFDTFVNTIQPLIAIVITDNKVMISFEYCLIVDNK